HQAPAGGPRAPPGRVEFRPAPEVHVAATTAPSASTLEHSPLSNPDIAPIPAERRTWNWWHYCALWIGMSVCITTYTLASGLIDSGMSWRQAMVTIFLGNS